MSSYYHKHYYMCPHTTVFTTICVFILIHSLLCVLILPHSLLYVSSSNAENHSRSATAPTLLRRTQYLHYYSTNYQLYYSAHLILAIERRKPLLEWCHSTNFTTAHTVPTLLRAHAAATVLQHTVQILLQRTPDPCNRRRNH